MKAFLLKPLPLTAIVATSTAVGDKANVGNDYAGVIWRSSAGTTIDLVIDLGRDVTFDTLMIFGLAQAPADATLQLFGATQAAGTAFSPGTWQSTAVPLYAGSNMLVNGRGVALWIAETAFAPVRYVIIRVAAATAFSVEFGRVVIGPRFTPSRNFSFGGNQGIRDFGTLEFSDRAGLLRRRGPKLRTIGLPFNSLYKEEVEAQVQPLLEYLGNTDCVALCTDPAANAMRQRRCYYGPLLGDLSTTMRNAVGWEWRANMVSLF